MSERDPIAELVSALQHDGRVPLAWVVRWSVGDRDPVAAAWDRCKQPAPMCGLLALVDRAVACRALDAVTGTPPGDDRSERRAEAIRRAVPVPPTLAELLAGAGRR